MFIILLWFSLNLAAVVNVNPTIPVQVVLFGLATCAREPHEFNYIAVCE